MEKVLKSKLTLATTDASMAVFMVDLDHMELTLEQLAKMQKKAVDMSQRFTEDERPVQYLRSVYIPSEAHCISFFASPSVVFVRDVNEAAQIPFTRIVQVIELTP